jgi:hypothetical protein
VTINDAIAALERAKARGVKSVILAWWEADMFDRQDNEDWERATEIAEDKMDWSAAHSDLQMTLDRYTSE